MTYTVALPDGRTVEFPDSVPKERAAELLRQQFPAPEAKAAGFSVSDIFTSLGLGALGGTKALTDVAGAGNVVSEKLGQASESLQQRLSPERQAEIRRQQERAEKAATSGSTLEEIKAGAQSVFEAPLQSTAQALGSFAPILATLFLGPGAAALGLGARATAVATNIAKAAPVAIGTAQGAGAVKGAIYEGVYKAERKDGVSEDEAKEKATAAQDYFGQNIDQILVGAGAGYVSGRFGAERLLTPGAAAKAEGSMLGRVGTALATDVPTEAFQGGQEQFAQNLALQREGRDVPLFQGVAAQATQEGLMGALGSGPIAAIRGPGDARLREEQDRRAAESAQLQAQADAQRAEQEAFKQTPEYLDDIEKRFAQIKAQEKQLKDAVPARADKDDLLAVEERRRAVEALNEFKKSDEYVNTIDEYTQAYDQLRPRAQERKAAEVEKQRVERVQAAPEGTQLDLAGEPGAAQDMSQQGQVESLKQYIASFDKQIKQAQAAGDRNQVLALQNKQYEAQQQLATIAISESLPEQIKSLSQDFGGFTEKIKQAAGDEEQVRKLLVEQYKVQQQITSLLPDASMLDEAKALAQRNLENYQTQIQTLTEQPNKKPEQYRQLEQLSNTANQVRQAIAGIESTQKTVEQYAPVEKQKAIDKPREIAKLNKKLEDQAALGEDIGPTLEKLRALDTVAEQPALFGDEDLRDVVPRDLGDIMADERERVKALREKLDAERASLQRMAATPQTQLTEEVQRRKKELTEEARKTAQELQQRNKDLYEFEKKQTLLDKLRKEKRTPLVAQGIEAIQQQIAALQKKLQAQEPKVRVQQPRTKLPEAAPEGEFAPRVTDAQLTEQRDRDIAALLDKFLPGALGVTPTLEVLKVQGPEGPREVRLTTLGSTSSKALRQELENVNRRRDDAVVELFDSRGPTANALRSEIVMLVTREVELNRQLSKLDPLSNEYRKDLQSLVRQTFTRPSAIPKNRTPNLAEQQYLDAVDNMQRVEDATLDDIYAMNKLAYNARQRGVVDITALVQNNPVMQAGRDAEARLSAAQKRVDEAAKRMPQLPDLTEQALEDKIDTLAAEFSEGTPQQLSTATKARRVPAAVRPPALLGVDIPAQIAANNRQIEQLNKDIQYAGKPSGAEKVAALNKMKAERDQRREENQRLDAQLTTIRGKLGQAAEPAAPAEEIGEVAEMRQELATIERTLASDKKELKQLQEQLQEQQKKEQTPKIQEEVATLGRRIKQFEARANITRQLEAARDDLKERLQAQGAKPVETPSTEEQLGFRTGPASKFQLTELKPVTAEMTKARTAIVAATQRIEDIHKAAGRVSDMGEQYFREVATTYQLQLDKDNNALNNIKAAIARVLKGQEEAQLAINAARTPEQKATAVKNLDELRQREVDLKDLQTVRERRKAGMREAIAEVQRFLNLSRLAGVNKTTSLRESLAQALDRALADREKKEAALAELQKKQRMYEQQEAARRGIDLGEAEAEKITAGEAEGFVSVSGKALGEKPKAQRSGVISKDSKVKVIKPDQSKKLEEAIQTAAALVGEARREKETAKEALQAQTPSAERLASLKQALTALEKQVNAHYNATQIAELQAEIGQLQARLAALPVAPAIADVAEQYNKASTATKGLPAPERVAQLMFDKSSAEQKAAAQFKAAEQAVAAAQAKYAAAGKALSQAEKKVAKTLPQGFKVRNPQRLQGIKLQISNLLASAPKLRDDIQNALYAQSEAEKNYMAARLERLLLNQQMGEHAKRDAASITAQLASAADAVANLQKQLSTATANEVAMRSKLDKSSAALEKALDDAEIARQAARNAERLAQEQAQTSALDAAKDAQDRADALRTGLGLPGRRVERDTAGKVMTAVQADIRQRMAAAETNLSKAIKAGNPDAIRKYTAEVEATTRELAQVYSKAPLTVSEVGAAAQARKRSAGLTAKQKEKTLESVQKELDEAVIELRDATNRNDTAAIKAADAKVEELITLRDAYAVQTAAQPEVVEGVRSTSRREGPAVRYVRGGSKAIMQAGAVKLRAAGMSQDAANAVSLYVAKSRIRGAKDTAKVEELTQAFDALTDGMTEEQIKAAVAEGKRLMGLGPTAELIAKRVTYQEALANVSKAEQDLREAKSNVTKELAQDALDLAKQRVESASNSYDQAKALYETSQIRTAKKAEKDAVEALFDETEIAQDTKGAKLGKGAGRTAAAIEGSVFRTTDTAGPGMKAQRVRDVALKVASEWSVVPDIFVVEDIDGLPENIREQAIKAGVADNIPGVYDPATKTAYLVASNLKTTEDVLLTLAHEVAGHFGLREVLGSSYARTMQKLYAGNKLVRDRANEKMQAQKFLDQNTAVEEVLADMAETGASPQERNLLQRVYDFVKRWLKDTFPSLKIDRVTDNDVRQVVANARRYVTNADKSLLEGGAAATSGVVYRTAPESSIVGRPAGTLATLHGNFFGLAGRVQLVDRLAAADKAFVEGQKDGKLSSLEAENAQYFLRMGDMTTQAAGQFITNGPVRIIKDRIADRVEERYESQSGATLVRVTDYMERAGQEGLGSAQEVETLLTVKIAGDRANTIPRGWERLFSENPAKAKAEYDAAVAKINANPAAKKFMDAAAVEYKAYNDGLMDFAEQTGFITTEDARRLKKTPYVPYYRIDGGVVKLFVDRETPLVIGNIKDNPDLQQLLGDNKQIMPLLTSAVQNTFMLTRMGLRNKATQETASALEKAGFVSKMGEGMGLANVDTVHYKYKGKPYFATIDADQFGIPADLIVKGMEGIKTTIPDIVRLMGVPANWIRTFVTRSPAYVLRQLIRDPLSAAITGGVDGVPVLNAMKQLAKMKAGTNTSADALMRGLTVSSNIYTGNEQDMQKFLEAASGGRGKWSKLMGVFDQLALESDAATRTVVYEDSLKKGLSERQAQFRALEVQNFGRRGLSPSVQYMATLVPFFNAQIQGLDVLYRSFRGDMPFSEKLEIRKKIVSRGLLLTATALGYAFMMRDNEEYKKATPEERYSNFFVPIPGTKDMFKIPIPYEVGLLFKALPEALLDAIIGDTKATEAAKGIGKLLLQSAPGVIPAAGKPLIEAAYGQTLIGPIESEREKRLFAGQRFRENTPEVLKTLGSYTGAIGISPLLLEHFARGYTSTLGVSVLRALDPIMGEALDNKATTPLSKTPFIGGLFQTADGRFLIERAYNRMEEVTQAADSYKDLQKRGKKAEAEAFAQRHADLLAASDMAGTFRQRSGQMFADERAVRADPSLSREQKDALLAKIKAAQQMEAKQFSEASDKTTRQAARP
jgi:hypothetical protein